MKNKKIWKGIRIPERIYDMILDMEQLLNTAEFTETLIYILQDWEKHRYLPEKERLVKLQQLRFELLRKYDETKRPA